MAKRRTQSDKTAEKTAPLPLDVDEQAPAENMPPSQNGHMAEEEKSSTFKQLNRPSCPMCNELMHAVSTQTRAQDGPVTYYRCMNDKCPEKSLLPVPRTEFIKYREQNKGRSEQDIEQTNVAARPDMKGVG